MERYAKKKFFCYYIVLSRKRKHQSTVFTHQRNCISYTLQSEIWIAAFRRHTLYQTRKAYFPSFQYYLNVQPKAHLFPSIRLQTPPVLFYFV